MNEDHSHLNSLSIAHYVVGGAMVLFSCIPLIHTAIGLSFILGGEESAAHPEQGPPRLFGWMFFLLGLCFFLLGQAVSIAIIASGRFLRRRENYMFSFVLACIACFFVPVGTILGVFTIIVLSRDSVKELYKEQKKLTQSA